MAHEDCITVDTYVAALNRLYPEETSLVRLLISASLTDELPKLEDVFHDDRKYIKLAVLAFYNELGVVIVLAQRTTDKTHLEKARPVLECLGDRRSLRRLQEGEAALARHAAA